MAAQPWHSHGTEMVLLGGWNLSALEGLNGQMASPAHLESFVIETAWAGG